MISTRFHYQLYVTIFLALLLVVAATIELWQLSGRKNDPEIILETVDSIEARRLLSPTADPTARRQFLTDLSNLGGLDFALFDSDHRLIDAVGIGSGVNAYEAGGPAIGIWLRSGDWIEARGFSQTEELFDRVTLIVPWGILIAVLCYPLVRRLTRRLERLQSSVEALGQAASTQ